MEEGRRYKEISKDKVVQRGTHMESKPTVEGPVDGNAFAIIGAVSKALRSAGQSAKIPGYLEKAQSGDYNHLLTISREYVNFKP